jgi:hypothetical protein
MMNFNFIELVGMRDRDRERRREGGVTWPITTGFKKLQKRRERDKK